MKPRVLKASLQAEGLASIEEAARALTRGELVAFPTETVYGIGCNANDQAALERLRELKGRAPEKPFSIHIGRKSDVERHADHVPPIARKLMDRYWPGPLTIVFPGAGRRGVGMRMPSNLIALELLRRTAVPVVAPSANRSGQPPATSAQQVAESLGNGLDLILDGGTTRLQEASTVVRATGDGWEILREGSLTADMLRRTLGRTILFVCTANSCRSPMAEMLCKKLLAERLGCSIEDLEARGYNVLSAGTAALWDLGASEAAVEAMGRFGLELANHKSRPLTPGLLDDADVVFVMARHHGESIGEMYPEVADKLRMLDPTGADVRDPVGGSVELFLECAECIRRHTEANMDLILGKSG